MTAYSCYLIGSGMFVRHGIARGAVASIELPGQRAIEGYFDAKSHYYDEERNQVSMRPPPPPIVLDTPSIAADGIDAATITNIPEGAQIRRNGPTGRANFEADPDGRYVLVTSEPGVYNIEIRAWPAQDVVIEVKAT